MFQTRYRIHAAPEFGQWHQISRGGMLDQALSLFDQYPDLTSVTLDSVTGSIEYRRAQ